MRPLGAGESLLVERAFVLTAAWRPGETRGEEHWRADPAFASYTAGWGRAGDGGLVAVEQDEPIGILWWRLFSDGEPGYGFVDAETPELGIAVVPEWRGRGVGRALLRGAIAEHPRLSLNVEDGNPAEALYRSEGFVPVGRSGDGTVMLRG